MLNFHSKIAKNHRQGKVLQIAGSRMKFVPFAFRIIHFGKDDIEGFLGNVSIFLITGARLNCPKAMAANVYEKILYGSTNGLPERSSEKYQL